MTTPIQNLTQTLTGLMGGIAPTSQQITNVATAFFYRMVDGDAMTHFNYLKAAMTAEDKAQWANSSIRRWLKQYVIESGVDTASEAASAASDAVGIANAVGL